MTALSLAELARATGGELFRGDPQTVVNSFAIDTRKLEAGGVFFALRGTHADGHAFLDSAARAGAAAAVVQQVPPDDGPIPQALIRVRDTVDALGRCGALARKKNNGLKVIALTGSTGKTITKELLGEGLSTRHRVHRTPGNLNNQLGVPLTLLACPDDAEIAVVELGMSGPGEIASLSRMTNPDVALVTNISPVHLQFFRDLDDVAAAKGELFATLRPDGTAVVNLDDENLRVQSQRHAGKRVTFGRHPSADLRLESLEDRFRPGAALTFRYNDQVRTLRLRMGGAHAAWNALAALAAVVAVGGALDDAMEAMAQVESGPGRGKIHQLPDEIVLVDDTYNSNPAALASVLRTLGTSSATGRKVLVMGEMLELGRQEVSLHKEAGRHVAAAGVRLLFGVGPLAHVAAEAARRAGVPEVHQHQDASSAARELPECLQPGDLVVVKGSRALRLEQVVNAVIRALGGDR